jgi:CheY-like chemotaxis protein
MLEAHFVIYLRYFFGGIELDSSCKLSVMTVLIHFLEVANVPGMRKARRGNQCMEKPFALIIEDDRDISALFRHVLDIAGYHTEIILHGKEAIQRLESARPDIVLLDLHLPGISGIQILEHVRADKRLKSVPVVVITAYARDAESLPVEPDLVLMKPVDLEQLSNLVQRLRTTPSSLGEPPWDEATHLYNGSFFTMRLTYSLERVKQMDYHRFGVLFAEVAPISPLRQLSDERRFDEFLHDTAKYLRTILRPTDTISRFSEGLFLILLEDIFDQDIPTRIVTRVKKELGKHLFEKHFESALQICAGVVLCGDSYQTTDEIFGDLDLARKLARQSKEKIIYDRNALLMFRSTFADS